MPTPVFRRQAKAVLTYTAVSRNLVLHNRKSVSNNMLNGLWVNGSLSLLDQSSHCFNVIEVDSMNMH